MKNKAISKQMIERIVSNDNSSFVDNISSKVEGLVGSAISDLAQKISYINVKNVILQPMNELMTGAMTDNSKFVYFLGIDNVQIDLNTSKSTRFWKDLKAKVIHAWRTRGSAKRARKRMQKLSEKEALKPHEIVFDPSKYDLFNLTEDLQNAFTKYLSNTSMIYIDGNQLKIIGKDDFGSNTQIIIYVTLYDGENFKYYLGQRQGYLEININSRIDAINKKLENVGEVFFDILKVYNVLYFEVNNVLPNQIFAESLICNSPDELFVPDDAYKSFVKIINYFTVKFIKDFKSIATNKPLFEDKLAGNYAFGHSKLMNYLNDITI